MTRSLPVVLIVAASLLSGTAFAQTPSKPVAGTVTTKTVVARPAAPAAGKPATTVATHTVARTTTRTTGARPRMVTAKLANGKTVTYNCSLAGNAAKQACK